MSPFLYENIKISVRVAVIMSINPLWMWVSGYEVHTICKLNWKSYNYINRNEKYPQFLYENTKISVRVAIIDYSTPAELGGRECSISFFNLTAQSHFQWEYSKHSFFSCYSRCKDRWGGDCPRCYLPCIPTYRSLPAQNLDNKNWFKDILESTYLPKKILLPRHSETWRG